MHTLAAWLHDLDPYLVEVAPGVGVRWYGVSYVAGFLVAYLLLHALAKRKLVLVPTERCADAIMLMAFAAVVGGRLGYVLFYEPSLLTHVSPSFPWWGVLELNRGGMASHGGMLGAIFGAWLVSRGWKAKGSAERVGRCPPLHVMDAIAAIAPPGLAFGRLANFINGELLGKVVALPGQPAPWWAVRFPQEHLTRHAPPLTPEQEHELTRLILDVAPDAPSFAAGYQTVLEALHRHTPTVAERLDPLVSARHPSQLYQAFAEGIVLMGVTWWVWRTPRKPGVVGGWWLITYGVLRIVTELWRLPDDHLAVARPLGLSRGQWLSAAMVIAGTIIVQWARTRTNAPRLGGWSRRAQAHAQASA